MEFLKFIDSNSYALIIAFSIIAIIFIMIGHIFRDQIQLLLKNDLAVFPAIHLDWWSVVHFFLFSVFGFIIPNKPISFLILGAGFEAFEDYMASDAQTQLVNCTDPEKKLWCRGKQDHYWYAKYDDVIVNTFGYLLGSGIRTTFF